MPYDFRFETEHEYGDNDLGITVPVTLRFGGEHVDLPAKIDTGSKFCIFQREYGEILGIDIENGSRQEISTAAGTFTAYGHDLSFALLGYEFDGVIYFAEPYNFNRDVLGRHGLIEKLKLCIVDYERKLYLSMYSN